MAAGTGEDPTWHLLLFLFVFGLLIWMVWHFFRTEILEVVRYTRLLELYIFALFDSGARACLTWTRIAPVGNYLPTPEVYKATFDCFGAQNIRSMPPAEAIQFFNVSPSSMSYVNGIAMKYMRWVVAVFCGALGYYSLYMSPRNKFKTRHTLESFIKLQATMWPVISPIVKFNPTKHSARAPGDPIPDKLPIFAEALSPEEWISFHCIPVVNGIPDRELVRRALLLQLGPRWSGLKNLPPHALALFAAFALMGVQKREESESILSRLATAWSPSQGFQMDSKLADDVKKAAYDPEIGGEALKIADKYAFRTTALLGVLRWARFRGGVLAPAYFLWLRAEDRALWYPLNNLGRRAFHAEAAGAMAHFMAEETAGKPLPIPRIDTAIVTINQYLASHTVTIPPHEGDKAVDFSR